MPNLVYEIQTHMPPPEFPRMRTPLGPVNPGHSPVRVPAQRDCIYECWDVVLVQVTRWPSLLDAELPENPVVLIIRDYINRHIPAHLEPLGPLPPAGDVDGWRHLGVVPPPAIPAWVIEEVKEALIGIDQVGIDCREVEERDAGLR